MTQVCWKVSYISLSLYGIVRREALRMAVEWCKRVSKSNVVVSICSDSNYVLSLLSNTTNILEWGSTKTKDAFIFDGPCEFHMVNIDILYPAARTFFHLANHQRT